MTTKIGARNQLTGTVTDIKKGDVMCEVKLDVATPAQMASVMTMESLAELGLQPGDKVKVVVKAISVLLMKA